MRKLFLLLLWVPLQAYSQCDLELLNFDLVDGTVTVAFNNTENCGGEGGPDGISEIQFGFQALDANCNAMNIGWDFPTGLSIPGDNNHPGWLYSATTTELMSNWTNDYGAEIDPPYYTGDTITFPLDNVYQETSGSMFFQLFDCLTYWADEGYSIQAVIWQISYGPTMYAEDGGWAEVGANGDGTSYGVGLYEDANWQDNWLVVGPCGDALPEVVYVYDTVYVELPPDTVVEYDTAYVTLFDTIVEYDTIPVAINWYFYDTTYIYITDTVVSEVYLTDYDTVYWTVYEVDTVYTYEYDMVEVDCATGLPCVEPIPECPIYIPNSFTPDNDGVNDVWGAETNASCWDSWTLRLYSRSGQTIWESYDPDDIWLGGDEYYVPSDVYVYRVECWSGTTTYIINGHVSVIR